MSLSVMWFYRKNKKTVQPIMVVQFLFYMLFRRNITLYEFAQFEP